MVQQLSKSMFTAVLTCDHTTCVFLLSLACSNFFPGSRSHFWGHYRLSFTLGGQSHLGHSHLSWGHLRPPRKPCVFGNGEDQPSVTHRRLGEDKEILETQPGYPLTLRRATSGPCMVWCGEGGGNLPVFIKFGAILKLNYEHMYYGGFSPVTSGQQVTIHGTDRAAIWCTIFPRKFQ